MILSWTVIGYIFHMWRALYANLIGRIAFFIGENIAHIEFYLQGLLPKILAIYTIKTFIFCEAVIVIVWIKVRLAVVGLTWLQEVCEKFTFLLLSCQKTCVGPCKSCFSSKTNLVVLDNWTTLFSSPEFFSASYHVTNWHFCHSGFFIREHWCLLTCCYPYSVRTNPKPHCPLFCISKHYFFEHRLAIKLWLVKHSNLFT